MGEDSGPSGEGPAKTDQGVGRISMIHGDVSTQRGDSGTWSAAILNQPVVNGDKVSTGDGGRAEVQLDYANALIDGSSGFKPCGQCASFHDGSPLDIGL